MDNTIKKAYKTIFGQEPAQSKKDWQLVKEILSEWDVPRLGEELAREFIFRAINHVHYPDEMTEELVGEAEEKAKELFPELEGRDPHMAIMEWLEFKERESREKKLPSEFKVK